LTEGKPSVESVVSFEIPGSELIRLIASVEQGSEHPMATAIVAAAKANGLALSGASEFRYLPGRGVTGKVDGKTVVAGNEKLFHELGLPADTHRANELRRDAQTEI